MRNYHQILAKIMINREYIKHYFYNELFLIQGNDK